MELLDGFSFGMTCISAFAGTDGYHSEEFCRISGMHLVDDHYSEIYHHSIEMKMISNKVKYQCRSWFLKLFIASASPSKFP